MLLLQRHGAHRRVGKVQPEPVNGHPASGICEPEIGRRGVELDLDCLRFSPLRIGLFEPVGISRHNAIYLLIHAEPTSFRLNVDHPPHRSTQADAKLIAMIADMGGNDWSLGEDGECLCACRDRGYDGPDIERADGVPQAYVRNPAEGDELLKELVAARRRFLRAIAVYAPVIFVKAPPDTGHGTVDGADRHIAEIWEEYPGFAMFDQVCEGGAVVGDLLFAIPQRKRLLSGPFLPGSDVPPIRLPVKQEAAVRNGCSLASVLDVEMCGVCDRLAIGGMRVKA